MTKRGVVFALFLAVAVAQIGLLGWMIVRYEVTLRDGRPFKFRTEPVDPYDAFRGRYVALRLSPTVAPLASVTHLERGTRAWGLLEEDEEGFARFRCVTVHRPESGDEYIPVTVEWSAEQEVHVALPFDRYYMKETAAPEAEQVYLEHSRRGQLDAYVVVRVRAGRVVLEELYVGGKPIKEYLKDVPSKQAPALSPSP